VIAILSSVWLQKQVRWIAKKEHTPCRIKKEGSQKYIARVQNSQKSKQKKRRKKGCHIT
jgi:hypothetical protein